MTSSSSGVVPCLAPNPPPTSGVMTWTWSGRDRTAGEGVARAVGALGARPLGEVVAVPAGRGHPALERDGGHALVDHPLADDDVAGDASAPIGSPWSSMTLVPTSGNSTISSAAAARGRGPVRGARRRPTPTRRRRRPAGAVSATTATMGSPTKRTTSVASRCCGIWWASSGEDSRGSTSMSSPVTRRRLRASAGVVDVDRLDAAVGGHRPHEGHVECVARRDVVDEGALAPEERRVLDRRTRVPRMLPEVGHGRLSTGSRRRRRAGRPEEEPLAQFDAEPADGVELGLGLDALGDDRARRSRWRSSGCRRPAPASPGRGRCRRTQDWSSFTNGAPRARMWARLAKPDPASSTESTTLRAQGGDGRAERVVVVDRFELAELEDQLRAEAGSSRVGEILLDDQGRGHVDREPDVGGQDAAGLDRQPRGRASSSAWPAPTRSASVKTLDAVGRRRRTGRAPRTRRRLGRRVGRPAGHDGELAGSRRCGV